MLTHKIAAALVSPESVKMFWLMGPISEFSAILFKSKTQESAFKQAS